MTAIADQISRFPQVNQLRGQLRQLHAGRPDLISMAGLEGLQRAFFPGANGLIAGEEADSFPVGGTLVLGSNFGASEKFRDPEGKLLSRADETHTHPTWSGLRARFTTEELADCFFTNAWPFLHRSPASGTRRSSNLGTPQRWLKDHALMASCLDFFRMTLRVVQPRLIVALGIAPAAFLGYAFPRELGAWQVCTLRALDDLPFAAIYPEYGRCVCAAITHPSQAAANARLRREPYRGSDGERRLLREAFAAAAEKEENHG